MRLHLFLGLFLLALPLPLLAAEEPPAAGKSISLMVVLAEIPAEVASDEPSAAEILAMVEQGKATSAAKYNLALLENNRGSLQFGENAPQATAWANQGEGGRRGSYSFQQVGTTIEATARQEQDGGVLVELNLQQSQLAPANPNNEQDAPLPRGIVTHTTQTTVRVVAGQPTILSSQLKRRGEHSSNSYVVVLAQTGEGAKPAAAQTTTTKIFALAHARAADMVDVIRPLLGPQRVAMAADERTNSLIVSAPDSIQQIIQALLSRLDEAN